MGASENPLIFHERMRLGGGMDNPEGVKRALAGGEAVCGVFLICVEPTGRNLMEILHSTQLFKSVHRRKRYVAVGMAGGREEALRLLVRIVEDYLRGGNDLRDFKKYYLN